MSQNRHASRVSKNAKDSSLLKGLLYDDAGNRMSPTYGMRRQKKYRYYVSRALLEGRAGEAGSVARVQAQELEAVVLAKQKIDRIERVVISEDQIMIHCRDDEIIKVKYKAALHKGRVKFLDENGAEMIPSKPNPVLVDALIRAWGWRRKLESGEAHSIKQIAVAENITDRYVSRLLRLTYLAPDIIGAILSGKQKGDFTLEKLRPTHPVKTGLNRGQCCDFRSEPVLGATENLDKNRPFGVLYLSISGSGVRVPVRPPYFIKS